MIFFKMHIFQVAKKCVNSKAIGNLFPNLYGHHSHKNTTKIHSINEKNEMS